ncbi:MAG: tetratricopeptide repeat protein, partial [Desulfobacteraceae bacterium]|nr:tetratricopeptide repeat protein [Desulfobacteraceae bacterium]
VFDSGLDGPFEYKIETDPEGLLVTIPEGAAAAPIAQAVAAMPPVAPAMISPKIDQPVTPAPTKVSTKKPAKGAIPPPAVPSGKTPAQPSQDEMAMAGYHAQKISVDFYKIDLHNVFRLIGEISGRNIVVDEGVNGTLTLAMNEVPWDFVLDVILNLKGLQKEERFNTIVISPKDKKYAWPSKPIDSLEVSGSGKEIINVTQKIDTPPEVIEAKKLILQGNEYYRAGRYDAALPVYEEAFAKWPANQQLAERIAAMALVQLGNNAKAVHYAKAVLHLDPGSSDAALTAAVALANMKMTQEAKEYFDKAIASSKPSAEALTSYAAFCEDNDSLESSLALLAKHEAIYGDTLETMIAKARIEDKLGRSQEANEEYRAILLSGFKIPADLKRYIKGRMAVAKQ